MNFKLYYTGYNGNFSASLYLNDQCLATETGLKTPKACRKWGKSEAALHKLSLLATPAREETVSVSGHEAFSL